MSKSTGTYIGVKFYKGPIYELNTVTRLRSYLKENNIPNPIRSNHFHSTLIFSRKPFEFKLQSGGLYKMAMTGIPTKLSVWPNHTSSDKNCLVLEYECHALSQRHTYYRDQYGATHDFPTFDPHITLSYDVEDFDISTLELPNVPITIVSEYTEELNL